MATEFYTIRILVRCLTYQFSLQSIVWPPKVAGLWTFYPILPTLYKESARKELKVIISGIISQKIKIPLTRKFTVVIYAKMKISVRFLTPKKTNLTFYPSCWLGSFWSVFIISSIVKWICSRINIFIQESFDSNLSKYFISHSGFTIHLYLQKLQEHVR